MEFKDTQAIYLQIVDLVCDYIVSRKWEPEGRIPSIRELGVQLEVNPNTVMRSYECLQSQGIIYNKRGVGFFVAIDADKQITESRQKEFLEIELPHFCQRMKSLEVPLERFISEYEKQ